MLILDFKDQSVEANQQLQWLATRLFDLVSTLVDPNAPPETNIKTSNGEIDSSSTTLAAHMENHFIEQHRLRKDFEHLLSMLEKSVFGPNYNETACDEVPSTQPPSGLRSPGPEMNAAASGAGMSMMGGIR